MSVILREKHLKKRKISLYLDIYWNGKREYRFLKLYLIDRPKDQKERNYNKEIKRRADSARIKEEDFQLNNTGVKGSNIIFLDYFLLMVSERKNSPGNHAIWSATYNLLSEFFNGERVKLTDMNDERLERFKNFLLNTYQTKSKKYLNQNTAWLYFSKVKASLNKAISEKLLASKTNVKSISVLKTVREYLTIDEVKAIETVDCEVPLIKNAFLFSVYTGLRWSDIAHIRWRNLRSTPNGHRLVYEQQKTATGENTPIAEKALSFIGERQGDEELIFKGLKHGTYYNIKLKKWLAKAGIHRPITFHCARHSFATILLTKKIDIYTVSKMLGHANLRTTEIYAKVIDQSKVDAANALDKL